MKNLRSLLVVGILALAVAAMALYPKLSNTLIGMPTNGATPSGEIRVDQSKLYNEPAQVQVRMKNVNFPDGTELGLYVDGQYFGNLRVVSKQVSQTLYVFLMTGRGARVYVYAPDGSIVAYQTSTWKV
ncbi:MAG: hypothetical protein ACAH95_17270 [Fimbriimonas sp.]